MYRVVSVFAVCLCSAATASAQDVGMPGIYYSDVIAGGMGGQLYPFDRQDPWLHGQYQRVPAYGGFSSFRPYNYRHVFSQTQIATNVWGSSHGMPYSNQFWNRYRTDYLDGNVHSQAAATPVVPAPVSAAGYQSPAPGPCRETSQSGTTLPQRGPIHVYPSSRSGI